MFRLWYDNVLTVIFASACCAMAPAQATQYAPSRVSTIDISPGSALQRASSENFEYNFCQKPTCTDGETPEAGLIADSTGALYGTTVQGGLNGSFGTVFKLTRHGSTYTERVLYRFCSRARCDDGLAPQASLILDAKGVLYGTTSAGGEHNSGTVFKLAPHGATYVESVLHSFCAQLNCADGAYLLGALIEDLAGGLYGTSATGGANGYVRYLS